MLEKCRVIFEKNPSGVFYSGDTVSGIVCIFLEESTKINELTLIAKGCSKCSWIDNKKRFEGKDKHFKIFVDLHNKTEELRNQPVFMESGQHSYPFSFALPDFIPSSFESNLGYTRYTIKIKATRILRLANKVQMAFTVISKSDLNKVSNCIIPITCDTNRGFNSLTSSKGALSMTVSVPMTGFLPGQEIPITCKIINFSDVQVKETTYSLVRIITYSATSPYRETNILKQTIVKFVGQGVNKQEEGSVSAILAVPAVPPTTIVSAWSGSNSVLVDYELKIKAKVPIAHNDVSIKIPITIGIIPLNSQPRFDTRPVLKKFYEGIEPLEREPTTVCFSALHYEMLPILMDESQEIGSKKLKGKIEKFKPKYPIFNFSDNRFFYITRL